MTTMQDMIADVRRMAYGTLNDQINLVATQYTAGAATLVLDMDVSNITPGMVLSGGLNVWYVKGTDPTTKTVYVIPKFDNSPEATLPVGTFVYIKPRVTDWNLFSTINEEILRMSSPENGLYKIASWTANVDSTWQTYPIPSAAQDMIGMLRVRYRVPGSDDTWVDIPDKTYRMQMNVDTFYVRLLRNIPSGTDIEFIYKAPFTPATSVTDDVVADCGLTPSMVDIPPLGAYASLMRTTESRRNQVQMQGDARRAQEVSSGANVNMYASIERDYKSRINEELARLTQRNSIQRSL